MSFLHFAHHFHLPSKTSSSDRRFHDPPRVYYSRQRRRLSGHNHPDPQEVRLRKLHPPLEAWPGLRWSFILFNIGWVPIQSCSPTKISSPFIQYPLLFEECTLRGFLRVANTISYIPGSRDHTSGHLSPQFPRHLQPLTFCPIWQRPTLVLKKCPLIRGPLVGRVSLCSCELLKQCQSFGYLVVITPVHRLV